MQFLRYAYGIYKNIALSLYIFLNFILKVVLSSF